MNRIRQLREEKGISQKVLALELHLSQPTICKWEDGSKHPSSKNVSKVADFFNVTVDYLLGRTDLPFDEEQTKEQPTTKSDELRNEIKALLEDLPDLSDQEIQLVSDFVSVLKGHREAAAADPHSDPPESR